MSGAADDRQQAAHLPEGDVIRILLEQHARIRDLFDEIGSAAGPSGLAAHGEVPPRRVVRDELPPQPLEHAGSPTSSCPTRRTPQPGPTSMPPGCAARSLTGHTGPPRPTCPATASGSRILGPASVICSHGWDGLTQEDVSRGLGRLGRLVE